MSVRRNRLLAALGATALLLALTGCGGSDDKLDAKASSSSSSSSSPSSDSGDSGSPVAERLTKANFADLMLANAKQEKSAHIKAQIGSSLTMEGDVDYSGDDPAMSVTMGMGGAEGKMVYVDEVLYMQMPGMTQQGKWTTLTKDDKTLGNLVSQLDDMDPRGALDSMKDGLKDIAYVGTTAIDGEDYDQYTVTVDTTSGAVDLGEGTNLPDTLTYQLYVDADHLVRRTVVDVAGQTVTVDVTDWGKPVTVKAPPASDVVKVG